MFLRQETFTFGAFMPVTSSLHGDERVRGSAIVAALPSDNQDNMIKMTIRAFPLS